jgi:PAS domain S-box-containing protein
MERSSTDALAQRFHLRVGLAGDFVSSYVADLIRRERIQAEVFLTDTVVDERDFLRSVAGFGYPAAVLLDAHGRVLQVAPPNPSVRGVDLTGRYPHLRTAVREGRPAVSPVVPSAAKGVPVVGFAVPFDTTSGRRVFSGAVEVGDSPLSSYLSSAISMPDIKVQLVDASGAIVAANEPHDAGLPTLNSRNPALVAAIGRHADGRYRDDGRWWRYASQAIPGTSWQLSATVTEDVLFAPVAGNHVAARAAVATAAIVGLLVVAAAARARRNRRELLLSEQRFRKVFDNSRIGMTLTDPDGRFVRVNPTLCQILGRGEAELLDRTVVDISHPSDTAQGIADRRDCLAGRTDGYDAERRYVHADGHTVEASVTSALLRDEAGRAQYFANQIIDVTERRALERAREHHEAELAERAEQLQQANAQMNDFIAMLSHDVRQPLTSVIATTELLLDDWTGTDDTTKHRDVQRIATAGNRADRLVTEILTLAQLDAGAITARPVHLDIHQAVREAVTSLDAGPNYSIDVTAPDQIDALVDPAHLQLMLANLLGNAVKYGAPPIDITVVRSGDHVQVRISDHGEGVPADFAAHLFDRFARADTGVAMAKTGTGLGLYLVRQLARAGAATVEYERHNPEGATFVLALPGAPAAPDPDSSAPAASTATQRS